MSYWYFVAKLAAFGVFLGVLTWMRARRKNRAPAETALMWFGIWYVGALFFGATLMAAAILIKGDPPRGAVYPVLGLIVAAAIVALIGGSISAWAARRIERLGPDPDYGEPAEKPAAAAGPLSPEGRARP